MRGNKVWLSTLWPAAGFTAFLVSGNIKKYYPFVFVFCVFYGTVLVLPTGGDAQRHFSTFQHFAGMNWSGLLNEISNFLNLRSAKHTDLYLLISNFLVSRISNSSSVYFGFHALVYALIYIASLRLILDNVRVKYSLILYTLFLLLVFVAPIAKIQYVRYFLAMWLFIYGVVLILKKGRKSGYLFFVLSALVHFAFWLPAFLFLLFYWFRNRLTLWFIVALISFSANNILSRYSTTIVQKVSIYSSDSAIESKTKGYVGNESYIEQRAARFDDRRWYTRYSFYTFSAISSILLVVFGLHVFEALEIKGYLRLSLTFSLFMFSISQLGSAFASVGERFQQVFLVASFIFLLELFKNRIPLILRLSFYASLPIFGLFLVMSLREMLSLSDLFTFFGNPYISYFVEREPFLDFLN